MFFDRQKYGKDSYDSFNPKEILNFAYEINGFVVGRIGLPKVEFIVIAAVK